MNLNALFEKSRCGDIESEKKLFQALSVRFRLFVFQRVLNEEDGEEIVQEALLKILELYKNIDIKSSFSAWAYKLLEYRIYNYYRQKKRQGISSEFSDDDDINLLEWPYDPGFEKELLNCLKKIGKTNMRFARILNLKFQGYSADEICRKLGITPGNLYVIVSRARSMLQECLERGK